MNRLISALRSHKPSFKPKIEKSHQCSYPQSVLLHSASSRPFSSLLQKNSILLKQNWNVENSIKRKEKIKKVSIGRQERSIYSATDAKKRTELSDVARKDLFDPKSGDEIIKIWVEHHRYQDCLAGVSDSKKFEEIRKRSAFCPIFVLPLSRGEGSLTVLTRSEMDNESNTKIVYFTLMSMYQEQGPATPPILSLYFFTDYQKSKNVVLMKGIYDPLQRTNVTSTELQSLVQLWQIFLLDDSKYVHMRTFNHDSQKFNYTDVIKAADTLSIGIDDSPVNFQRGLLGDYPKDFNESVDASQPQIEPEEEERQLLEGEKKTSFEPDRNQEMMKEFEGIKQFEVHDTVVQAKSPYGKK